VPAEAIHLSALADLRQRSPGLRRTLGSPRAEAAARVGAMFVDLPYFQHMRRGLLRYLVGLPQADSPWGDRFHQRAPIALGVRLAEEGASLRRERATREDGDALVALAAGYFSHAAVDTALHPLVNRLALARGARLGTPGFIREHQEVEKLQSVLFHEARHGIDYLGTAQLAAFVAIDWRVLERSGPVCIAIERAMSSALGLAPKRGDYASWARGYRFFVSVISGPLGRRAVSPADKERERPELLYACDLPGRFTAAVERSERWIDALLAYVDDGRFDASARVALDRHIPEQSLDPPPEGVDFSASGDEISTPR
jgi:hypothetical protein